MTDKQGRAAVASLVTAGSVLLGTALLAAGCASNGPPARSPVSDSPVFDSPVSDSPVSHSPAARGTAATTAELTAMAARYMAIARPANLELDQARAALTSTAAGVTSMRELRGYQKRLDAANGPVENEVRVIRAQLGLPPPDTS